jgi:hypothetical protein
MAVMRNGVVVRRIAGIRPKLLLLRAVCEGVVVGLVAVARSVQLFLTISDVAGDTRGLLFLRISNGGGRRERS